MREVLSGLSARSRLIVLLTIELSLLGRQLQRALAGAGRTTIIGVGLTAGLIGVTIAWRCGWSRAVRRFLRTRVRELAIFAGAALCGGALMVLTLQPELIELSHVAVFGGLGASLLLDRLVREEVLAKAATQALLLAVTAGIFDELLQLAHPERVADVRDVALNACGGAIGVLAVALSIQGSRRKQSD